MPYVCKLLLLLLLAARQDGCELGDASALLHWVQGKALLVLQQWHRQPVLTLT